MWDGEIRKLRKWLTKVYSFFVPSPLCGMETVGLAYMPTRMYRRSSKPTAWDGDSLFLSHKKTSPFVPSPLCGMATHTPRESMQVLDGVLSLLSPPRGMVTAVLSCPPALQGDVLVPSPPCGMVTFGQRDH